MPEFLPERFEAGTVPTPAIVSLLAGIEYINNVGLQNIEEKNEYLTEKFADVIRSVEKCVLYEYGNGVLSSIFQVYLQTLCQTGLINSESVHEAVFIVHLSHTIALEHLK